MIHIVLLGYSFGLIRRLERCRRRRVVGRHERVEARHRRARCFNLRGPSLSLQRGRARITATISRRSSHDA